MLLHFDGKARPKIRAATEIQACGHEHTGQTNLIYSISVGKDLSLAVSCECLDHVLAKKAKLTPVNLTNFPR